MVEAYGMGLLVLLVLVPLAVFTWLWLFKFVLKSLGVNPETALVHITLPESVLYSGIGIAAAILVSAVYSRYI